MHWALVVNSLKKIIMSDNDLRETIRAQGKNKNLWVDKKQYISSSICKLPLREILKIQKTYCKRNMQQKKLASIFDTVTSAKANRCMLQAQFLDDYYSFKRQYTLGDIIPNSVKY